jgi:hypothetical protein
MDQVLAAIAAMSGSAFDPAVALCTRPEVPEAMAMTTARVPLPLEVSPGNGAVTRPAGHSRRPQLTLDRPRLDP